MSKAVYFPQLDTLRTIAAFGVINLHWLNSEYPSLFGIDHESAWDFGKYGVQLFFVLSGFLITDILIRHKHGTSRKRLIRSFFVRRVLRLIPIYYLFLLFLLLLDVSYVSEHTAWFFTYTANIRFWLSGGLVDVWSNHTWTLSIEEQFYLLFPFLMLFVRRKGEFIVVILFIVSALCFKAYHHDEALRYHLLIFAQTDMLGTGALLALLRIHRPRFFEALRTTTWRVIGSVSLGFCFLMFYTDQEGFLLHRLFDLCLLGGFTILVANTALGFEGWVGKVFENGFLRYLGKISYGLYLYHKIIPLTLLIVLNKLGIGIGNILVYYLVNLALLLSLSHLSWQLLEKPIMRLKQRFEYSNVSKA